MNYWVDNFGGIDKQGYGVEIYGGKHYNTPDGEFAELKHGQEYSIKVVNYNSHYCRVNLDIDGYCQGVWNFSPQTEAKLERPATIAKRFTFYRVKYAPTSSGIEKGKAENGLVSCTFTPEQDADMIEFKISHFGKEMPGAKFKMFGKATYGDFLAKLTKISKEHFQIKSQDELMYLLWDSNEDQATVQRILHVSSECEKKAEYICEDGFYEGVTYHISIVPKIKMIRLSYSFDGKSFDHNVLSECNLKDAVRAVKEKWSLSDFYIAFGYGTSVFHSEWDIPSFHLFCMIDKKGLMELSKTGVLPMTVSKELPNSNNLFTVDIKTMTGKTVNILAHEKTSIYAMKNTLQMLEGIPTEQMRLILDGGGQTEDHKLACDYPKLMERKILRLVLRLRGGGRAPIMDIESKSPFQESSVDSGSKSLNASDPSWKAGATTLGKKSDQEFGIAPPLIVDESKSVTLTVRLVARDDELSEADYQKFEDIECTLLATAVPPPIPE